MIDPILDLNIPLEDIETSMCHHRGWGIDLYLGFPDLASIEI